MRRYWIEGLKGENELISVTGDEFHHIFKVCRLQIGGVAELLSEDGFAYLAEAIEVQKKIAHFKVLEVRKLPELKKPYITLYLSLPKFETFEKVIEKSVELGVEQIYPFVSDYSFIKSSKSMYGKKLNRFEKIIKGALQQSGRGQKLRLMPLQSLAQVLSGYQHEGQCGLFAYEGEGGVPVTEAMRLQSKNQERVNLFVGSEGGFSRQEVESFQKVGLQPVSLGTQVLRVETACVSLLGIIKYNWDLF